MRLMDFDGRVAISQMSIPNATDAIVWRFFFTCDVQNLGVSSPMEQMRLNGNNSHPSVSSELFDNVQS